MTLRLGIKGESLRIYAARNIRGPGGSPSVLKHIPETRETPWKRTVTSLASVCNIFSPISLWVSGISWIDLFEGHGAYALGGFVPVIPARMNKIAFLEHRVTSAAQVVCKKLRTIKDPDAFFDTAQHEFSVALRTMSLDLLDSLDRRLNALGEKVARLEATTRRVVISRDARAGAQEITANFAAQQERAEKSLLSLWLQGYVRRLPRLRADADDHEEDVDLLLDAVDFAFCRCALNVAISSSSVSQEKLMSSRVVTILISMVDGANKVASASHFHFLIKSLSYIR